MQRSVKKMWLQSKEREGGQNDNTCFHRQCYMQKHTHTHIYIYIDLFIYRHAKNCDKKCGLNQKAGGGSWGEGAAPPPKQNDNTCFHRQCYMQKHIYIYIDTHMQKDVTKM